jgi:hypothetical protein
MSQTPRPLYPEKAVDLTSSNLHFIVYKYRVTRMLHLNEKGSSNSIFGESFR